MLTSRKQQFLDHVAKTYDMLAANGHEPVCIVFALVGESGHARSAYMTDDVVKACNVLHISRAVCVLNTDYRIWDEETMNDTYT